MPNKAESDLAKIPESIPRAPNQDNYKEWYDAVEGKIDQSESNFSLAGPMTETILLGVLAQRVPDTTLKWNAEEMEVTDRPELQKWIKRSYRNGWDIKV